MIICGVNWRRLGQSPPPRHAPNIQWRKKRPNGLNSWLLKRLLTSSTASCHWQEILIYLDKPTAWLYLLSRALRGSQSGTAPTVRLRETFGWDFTYNKMTEKHYAGTNTRCPCYVGVYERWLDSRFIEVLALRKTLTRQSLYEITPTSPLKK